MLKTMKTNLGVLLVGAGVLLVPGAGAQENDRVDFDSTRTKIQEWVQTEQLISEKKAEWQEAKGMLEARIELLQSQITDYEGRIEEAETEIAKTDEQKQDLVTQNAELKAATEKLKSIIGGLEKQVKGDVLTNLPEFLTDKIKPLTQKLPDNPEETEMSLSQRFQNLVGTLNEINKFNADISSATAIRDLGGKEVEVKTLYLGLGQAYYVNNDGTEAGVGRPGGGSGGWNWEPINQRAPEIMKLFQIMDGEAVAEFVPLPFEVE